jgi:hypothetical protein
MSGEYDVVVLGGGSSEAGEWLQQARLVIRPHPARRPGRHGPTVPNLLGDLRRRA